MSLWTALRGIFILNNKALWGLVLEADTGGLHKKIYRLQMIGSPHVFRAEKIAPSAISSKIKEAGLFLSDKP